MGMYSVRGFSTSNEDEGKSKGKGRFFKFLEKAETIDERVKVDPSEAKAVTKPEEELEDPAE